MGCHVYLFISYLCYLKILLDSTICKTTFLLHENRDAMYNGHVGLTKT